MFFFSPHHTPALFWLSLAVIFLETCAALAGPPMCSFMILSLYIYCNLFIL